MHYLGYTVQRISLYGSDQSQQSLYVACRIAIGYTNMFQLQVEYIRFEEHHGVVVYLPGFLYLFCAWEDGWFNSSFGIIVNFFLFITPM